MVNLSDLFAEQQTNVISWDGGQVFGLYEFPEIPERLTVEFQGAKDRPVQGIQLRMRGGTLRANDVEASNLVLWHDTAPGRIEIEVLRGSKRNVSLKIWNVWRVGSDVTQAWLGNSAMRVDADPAEDTVTLHCSDGEGEPDFDDLVVTVNLE